MRIPTVTFITRKDGEFVNVTTDELFGGKRVVLFALPGAFTPTCSSFQLPGFELDYDKFIEQGIDDVYCLSVNDGFVMNSWAKDQNISKVKMIPDGNGEFTVAMNMAVSKNNLGFAYRSWRYATIVNDGEIEKLFEEPGKCDDCPTDPYGESSPESVLSYLQSN